MNKAILIGNLAADPEINMTNSGIPVCRLRLAVQRPFANQQGKREADFFDVITWRQQAENCARYLSKGSKVAIEGSIQNRSYDAQDGSKRHVTEIMADRVEFLSGNAQSQHGGNAAPQAPQGNNDEFEQVEDDDLPF